MLARLFDPSSIIDAGDQDPKKTSGLIGSGIMNAPRMPDAACSSLKFS